jgi:hypothetical protein
MRNLPVIFLRRNWPIVGTTKQNQVFFYADAVSFTWRRFHPALKKPWNASCSGTLYNEQNNTKTKQGEKIMDMA